MATKSAHALVLSAWGKRIKRARLALDLTQVAAAERIGVSQGTLSRIESGDYQAMDPELILKVCTGLSIEDPESAFGWPPAIMEIARIKSGVAA